MSEGVTQAIRRNAVRFAMTGIVGIWLSGCADATRFSESGNPFSNPFATASNDTAPTPQISSTPLKPAKAYNSTYTTSARPSPTAVAAAPTPTPESTGSIRPSAVGGSANGWTAVGGAPIVVGANDDAGTLSGRFGVPEAALLSANGLRSRSDVRSGMRIVIPVYNAHGGAPTRVAKADVEDRDADKIRKVSKRDDDADSKKADRAEADHRKHKAEAKSDDDEDSDDDHASKKVDKAGKLKKVHEKTAEAADADKPAKKAEKTAKAEKVEHVKTAEAKPEKKATTEVAKAEPVKPSKKVETDKAPTGDLASAQSDASKQAENGQFRWPARGRIIQGFKSGGNDGINIALPEGTSVRAAEDGKVAYAGSALKGYGNLVLIRHPSGYVTAYANNGELDVKNGDTVKRGQVIAKSGQTGDVSTPQLHFELRKGQTPVDPTNYLAGL